MKTLGILLVGLIIGGAAGYSFAPKSGDEAREHLHDMKAQVDVDNVTLDFELIENPMGGQTLHVMTENFTFAPQNTGTEHVDGEGHAHVFVGDTFTLLYSNWLHIEGEAGEDVTVSLNGNDHAVLVKNGAPLTLTKPIP